MISALKLAKSTRKQQVLMKNKDFRIFYIGLQYSVVETRILQIQIYL